MESLVKSLIGTCMVLDCEPEWLLRESLQAGWLNLIEAAWIYRRLQEQRQSVKWLIKRVNPFAVELSRGNFQWKV